VKEKGGHLAEEDEIKEAKENGQKEHDAGEKK
jgi:hypothetical protein